MPGLGQRLKDLLRRSFDLPDKKAHLQGMELLKENLSPAQRDQLELFNYFEVIGGDTGTRYRVYLGDQVNVEMFDRRGNRGRLCFMPMGHLPTGDTMLAQKLALELFETETLRIANSNRLPWEDIARPPYGFRY